MTSFSEGAKGSEADPQISLELQLHTCSLSQLHSQHVKINSMLEQLY